MKFIDLIKRITSGKQGDEGQKRLVPKAGAIPAPGRPFNSAQGLRPAIDSLSCPYCFSKNFQKRGLRAKKLEKVQLYLCKDCGKTFTPQITKGKHYPLAVMLDALSVYNLGYSLEETCRITNQRRTTKKSAFADSGEPTQSRVGSGLSPENDTNTKINSCQEGVEVAEFASAGSWMTSQTPYSSTPTPQSSYTMQIQPSTLSNWLSEFKDNLPYLRLREFALKRYLPKDMVATATLAHRQLYRYRFHRAKCDLMIQEDIQHRKFRPMQEFLDLVPSETPHQYFLASAEPADQARHEPSTNSSQRRMASLGGQIVRASETPLTFSKTAMIVRGKTNFATKTAAFVLQSVKDRRLRHEALQKFMLYNDSVTVATEVPVYIMRDDIEHMKTQLGFEIYSRVIARSETTKQSNNEIATVATLPRNDDETKDALPKLPEVDADVAEIAKDLPKLITGHIDILQIRNGMVHILDYKPKAEKERPIEQLTLYAMALSRLTGLRLFEFKCAWFDEKDYFEFYPLHVLHKPKRAQRRRKVNTQEGTYLVNRDEKKIQKVRPEAI